MKHRMDTKFLTTIVFFETNILHLRAEQNFMIKSYNLRDGNTQNFNIILVLYIFFEGTFLHQYIYLVFYDRPL